MKGSVLYTMLSDLLSVLQKNNAHGYRLQGLGEKLL